MNILGTEYIFIKDDETLNEINADGECQGYSKIIRIRPAKSMLLPQDSIETKKKRYNETLRHEVIHAFFVSLLLKSIMVTKNLLTGLRYSFRRCTSCSKNMIVWSKAVISRC